MRNCDSSSLVGVGRDVVAGLVDKAEVQPCRWSWELWLVLGSGAKPVWWGRAVHRWQARCQLARLFGFFTPLQGHP